MVLTAAEVCEYLHSVGLVQYDPEGVTGDCYAYRMPNKPDHAVMVEIIGGPTSSIAHAYELPQLHLLVRGGLDPREAETRALDLYRHLHALDSVTLPRGTYVVSCRGIQSGPVPIGRDENGRFEFSLNFQLEVRVVDTRRQ